MLSLLLVCLSISLETDKLLDYCNSVLAGILLHFARRLQSVMNAAVIKVRSLYAAPIRQLHCMAKSSMADRLPADRSGLQKKWPDTVISRWRTSSSSRVGVSKASAFRFVSWTVCSPYINSQLYGDRLFLVATVYTDLEKSSAASLPVFCCRLKTYFFELCYP